MPIIVNKTGAIRGLPDGTRLQRGANEVSDETLETARKVPITAHLFDTHKLQVKAPPKPQEYQPGKPPAELGGLKVPEAKQAIRDCDDVALLTQWMENETRVNVRKSLLERYEEVRGPLVEDESGDEDEGPEFD